MLVLVTNSKDWFARSLVGLSLASLIVLGAPANLLGQTGSNSNTVSVLVSSDSGTGQSPASNSAARIESGSASNSGKLSILAPAQFSSEPQPPQELLMPQSPDRDSFTKPIVSSAEFTNELRGDDEQSNVQSNVVTASFTENRSQASGTLATTNQSRQNAPPQNNVQGSGQSSRQAPPRQFARSSGPPAPDNMSQPRGTFAPIVSSFGDSKPAVAPQAFSNSSSSNTSVPQASSWRTPTPGQSSHSNNPGYPPNRVASNQSGQETARPSNSAFNSGANSNYNQGINPRIASGVPQVAPMQQYPPNQNIASQPVRQTQRPIQRPNQRPNQRQAQPSFNRDGSVRPTGFAQPPTRPAAPRKVRTDLAKQLIARYSVDGMNPRELAGQPVKLLEMLNQPISTEQRRPMIHQYWDTYSDWASLVNSQQYARLLDDIPGSNRASDQAMLETAKMEAKNEVLASEIELVKSQSKLTQFMPNRSSSLPPPIPNDLPLIQKYNTQYERYKQFQLMPVNLLGIDKMLPKTLELIASQADTVQMAQSTNQKVVAGVRNGQSSVVDALSAAKAWRSAEQNLLVAVMDYNHAIADYSMTVSRGYQSPQQVVGMLIAKPRNTSPANSNANSTANAGGVADRFRNARNTVGNSQPATNSQFNNQRFNSQTSQQPNRIPSQQPRVASQSQPRTASGGFGGSNFGSGNSGGLNQQGSSQSGFQSGAETQQPVARTVEAGAASPFRSTSNRSTSNGFGNQNAAPGNVNRNSNTAAKSSQNFSLDSNSGFQPPATKSFGGQSQFSPPSQGTGGGQSPQSGPFARPSGPTGNPNPSSGSQFQFGG